MMQPATAILPERGLGDRLTAIAKVDVASGTTSDLVEGVTGTDYSPGPVSPDGRRAGASPVGSSSQTALA